MRREQIREVIRNREPFLLIDEITGLIPGQQAIAQLHLTGEEFWFSGHFPEYPLVPGSLIIEMIAQAAAVCALSLPENSGKVVSLAAVDKARFRRKVFPEETLTVEAKIIKTRGNTKFVRGSAEVNGEAVLSANLVIALSDALK
jgi:3-hydroxyacyl-[acyl-carrier-protein] dehydratase